MTAILPGSFDPVTLGHLDLVRRGSLLFDKIIIAILENHAKTPLFTVDERLEMLRKETSDIKGIEIEIFSGLLAEYAKKRGVKIILRGMRSETDAAYEIPMAQANKTINDELETFFLISDSSYGFVSSALIREISVLGKKTDFNDKILEKWVPASVLTALRKKQSCDIM